MDWNGHAFIAVDLRVETRLEVELKMKPTMTLNTSGDTGDQYIYS